MKCKAIIARRSNRRNGALKLFAVLEIAIGQVFTQTTEQKKRKGSQHFLDGIVAELPDEKDIHVILDNYAIHKQGEVRTWLAARPRFHLHFTPTYSSWISQVERWFAEIQRRCLDRGVFCSLEDLTTALQEWIKLWNDSARPFKWTKTPDQIIDSICRYCDRISRPAH